MNVAVTGCTSDFGTVILPRLFADPDVERVVGIDLREPRVRDSKLRFEREDVRSPRLRELFAGCDVVVHLAFVVAEIADKALTHDVNLNGSRNVIESAGAAGVHRLVLASSVASYGVHPDNPVPVTEDDFPRGNHDAYYFYDKAEVEHFIDFWQAQHPDSGMTITRLRPPYIAGPHFENPAIERFTAPALLVPGADTRFQLLHEDDLADGFMRAIRSDLPGPFNIGPPDSITDSEAAAMHGARVVRVPLRPARAAADLLFRLRLAPASSQWVLSGEAVLDSSKLERESGWAPRFTSRETLRIALVQAGRPIMDAAPELRRREVAEAALQPITELQRRWCEELPALREAVGGAEAFDEIVARIEHEWLPYKGRDFHLEIHPAAGEPRGTVVYSHGLGSNARFAAPTLGALAQRGFNVVGVDRPGHGLSHGPRGDCTLDMALDTLEIAFRHARERFGDPVLFLGSSMGGILGWSLLTRAPDIAGAVLHGIGHPDVAINRSDAVKYPLTRVLAKLAPHAPVPVGQIGDFGAVAAHPLSVEYFASRPERISCWAVSARSVGSLLAFRPQIDWSELAIPAMVVIGGEDRMLPPGYTRQCFDSSRLPGAELRVLAGAGHLLTHDSLPQLLEAIVPFFEEPGQPAPADSAMRV